MSRVITQDDYERVRAVEDRELRQWVVDGIDLKEFTKYVNQVDYEEEQDVDPTVTEIVLLAMITIPSVFARMHFKGTRSRIVVYPQTFMMERFSDFKGWLIYHEGYHAKEIYESPGLLVYPLVHGFGMTRYLDIRGTYKRRFREAEQRAFRNQLRNFDKDDFSPEYKMCVINSLDKKYRG